LIQNNVKGLKNDVARKHPKEMVLKAMELLKKCVKQKEIVSVTGLTQSYISNLKTKKRGLSLSGA
jgi:predicted XRE-type DNA-binding protein